MWSFNRKDFLKRGRKGLARLTTSTCSRVLLEKLTVAQLAKNLSAFYGPLMFITVFTTARNWPLSGDR